MNIEEIRTVGVVGAGSMGTGIIQVAAQSGFEVKAVDVDEAACARAAKAIAKVLERLVAKEKITADQMKEALGRISFSTDVNTLKDVPFIFEAVFEAVAVKKEFFAKLDAVAWDDTVYATNTSSISITEMASLVKRPAKFVGMHFFNPVPVMKLVEVIPALQTEQGDHRPGAGDGEEAGQDRDHLQGHPRVRREPASRAVHARRGPPSRGGRRVGRGYRHGDEARGPGCRWVPSNSWTTPAWKSLIMLGRSSTITRRRPGSPLPGCCGTW